MIAVIVPCPFGTRTGTLEQPRQFGEDGCRIAARDRRFARRGRDFADGMGETGDAIDDQKNVVALVAIMLGDGHGRQRRHLAQHRAFIAGRHHGDRLGQVFTERILDEFAHFTATFADQRDDHLVEGVGTGKHRQQASTCRRRSRRRRRDAGRGRAGKRCRLPARRCGSRARHACGSSTAARYWRSSRRTSP